MDRSDYRSAIFILAVTIAATLQQSIMFLLVGGALFRMEGFAFWFCVLQLVTLASTYFLLKYLHFKKYRFAFLASAVSSATGVCQSIIFLIFLMTGELRNLYIPVVFISLATGIAYSISMIVPPAGGKPWLKKTGFAMLAVAGVLLVASAWIMTSGDAGTKVVLEKVTQWTMLVGSLVPFFLIMNFRSEIRTLRLEHPDMPLHRSSESLWGLAAMVTLSLTVTFGVLMARESSSTLYWRKKNAEKTREFARLCETRSFTNDKGETLTYLLMSPKDYDPAQKYPLVVTLPYGGYESPMAQVLAEEGNAKKHPAFLFVPNCPEGEGWGGIPGYPTIDTLVFDAIVALENEVSIDPRRRYVMGISRGGYGSWHFICMRPDFFAAAVPVCGRGEPSCAPGVANVPVWAFHGEKDKNVPVSGSRDMIEGMRAAGGDPKYTEYAGEGHNIWHLASQTPGLWNWLFEQERE